MLSVPLKMFKFIGIEELSWASEHGLELLPIAPHLCEISPMLIQIQAEIVSIVKRLLR